MFIALQHSAVHEKDPPSADSVRHFRRLDKKAGDGSAFGVALRENLTEFSDAAVLENFSISQADPRSTANTRAQRPGVARQVHGGK